MVEIRNVKTRKGKSAIEIIMDVNHDGKPDRIRIYKRERGKPTSRPAEVTLSINTKSKSSKKSKSKTKKTTKKKRKKKK